MAKFKIGDRVRVVEEASKYYNQEATIVEENVYPCCLFDEELPECWAITRRMLEVIPLAHQVVGARYDYTNQNSLIRVSGADHMPVPEADHHQVGGNHYASFAIQPYEFIDANGIPFLEANAIKYLCRHKDKGGAMDLKKAMHFISLCLKRRYGVTPTITYLDEE